MTTAIDLFAGWGGFSLGAEAAGVEVLWAANHWKLAVDAHATNHPSAQHVCQDLNQANFYNTPDHDILLAAPACQGHSQASQPKRRRYHDILRATAWAVVSAADAKDPKVILVENVADFRRWRLYPAWRQALEAMGYSLSEQLITASHVGVPQRRKRLFIVATKSKNPLELPTPKGIEPGFGTCIDWNAGKWKPVASKSPRVLERIAKARARNLGPRFLTQHVTGHPGVPLHEPIRTITTGDQWAIVDGDMMRPLTLKENALAMGFPTTYKFPELATRTDVIRGLGNAVCPPVATWLLNEVLRTA
jgi:DNA (cytosine-5)-methyltransferase 1